MSAAIGEPVLVASFDIPASTRTARHYFGAAPVVSQGPDVELTLTIHGHSIHTLELATLHPVLSHTFPPSTTFPASAVSRRLRRDNGESVLETYIPTAHDAQKSTTEHRISKWEYASTSADQPPRQTATASLPFEVDSLSISDGASSHIVATSSSGGLTIFDNSLTAVFTHDSLSHNAVRLASSLIPANICTFQLPPVVQRQGGIFITTIWLDGRTLFQLFTISSHPALLGEASLETPIQPMHASMDSSGYITLLLPSGRWTSHQIDWRPHTGFSLTTSPEEITLSLPCFQDGTSPAPPKSQLSLLALGSSRVILSTIVPSNPADLLLLLWDLRYSVVLATASCPIPPSVAVLSPNELDICLTRVPSDQFCITICQSALSRRRPARCAALVASFSASAASTIAVAMGCLEETKKWNNIARPTNRGGAADLARQDLLDAVKADLKAEDVESANSKFFGWAESSSSRANADYQEVHFAPVKHRITGKPVTPRHSVTRNEAKAAVIPFQFTADLLEAFLSTESFTTHRTKVVNYLLERRLVSQNMVVGGLTNALLRLNDWESIDLALRTMSDIPESDLIRILVPLVSGSRASDTVDQSQMQTESPSTKSTQPALRDVLAKVIKYPTSPVPLRQAIHDQFSDVRDVIRLFEVLDQWLEQWVSKGPMVKFDAEIQNIKSIAAFDQIKKMERKLGIPPLVDIIHFSQVLMDASFVSLIQHAALQPTLARMKNNLSQFQTAHEALHLLRGYLEPFTRIREPEDLLEGSKPTKPKVKPNDASIPLKPYQIEELYL